MQRNLKEVLGAQFAEKEGEQLIKRAYNPKLEESVNKQRVGRLIKQIEMAYEAKRSAAEYFEANKTMAGWTGKMPTIDDFYQAIEDDSGASPGVKKWSDL